MITLKKSDINGVLLTLLCFADKDGMPIGGLLMEEISLGLKRKLQKIRNEALEHMAQLQKDSAEVNQKFAKDAAAIERELKILYDETVTINCDPVSIEQIEAIKTKTNYDFSMIEKFAG